MALSALHVGRSDPPGAIRPARALPNLGGPTAIKPDRWGRLDDALAEAGQAHEQALAKDAERYLLAVAPEPLRTREPALLTAQNFTAPTDASRSARRRVIAKDPNRPAASADRMPTRASGSGSGSGRVRKNALLSRADAARNKAAHLPVLLKSGVPRDVVVT
jgi:hypothetical protein